MKSKSFILILSVLIFLHIIINDNLLRDIDIRNSEIYKKAKKYGVQYFGSEYSCNKVNYTLKGDLKVPILPNDTYKLMDKIIFDNLHVQNGGYFSPKSCNSSEIIRESVAIIIPFRDRLKHLYIFLQHMHPFLTRQKLEYKIYLINQYGTDPFNRGKLINVGFKEAMKEKRWTCIVIHDIDYMPLNDFNFYKCLKQPRRLIVASSKWEYKYAAPYRNFFGGVSAMTPQQFNLVNGFYNDYYGWGGEDDDLAYRIIFMGMRIDMLNEKEGLKIGKYQMLGHNEAKPASDRHEKLSHSKDNLLKNGLSNLKYVMVSNVAERLYTNMTVNVLYEAKKKPKR